MDKLCDLWWAILWGFALNSDCQRLLVMQGVYLNQNGSLNCTATRFSVCDFFFQNLEMAYALYGSLGRVLPMEFLHMCYVMCINQHNGHWSLAIMFLISSITNIEPLAIFVKIWIFLLGIGLARIWKVFQGVSKLINTKYIPPLISLIFIWILKI